MDPHPHHGGLQNSEPVRSPAAAIEADAPTSSAPQSPTAVAAHHPAATADVERALFVSPNGAGASSPHRENTEEEEDDYERFGVADVLPASRRGSRSHQETGTLESTDSTHSATTVERVDESSGMTRPPPLEYQHYADHDQTTADNNVTKPQAQPSPPAEHWGGGGGGAAQSSNDANLSEATDLRQDLQAVAQTDDEAGDAPSSLPASWMRPVLEDVSPRPLVPPRAQCEPRDDGPLEVAAATHDTDPLCDSDDALVATAVAPSAPVEEDSAASSMVYHPVTPHWVRHPQATVVEVGGGDFGGGNSMSPAPEATTTSTSETGMPIQFDAPTTAWRFGADADDQHVKEEGSTLTASDYFRRADAEAAAVQVSAHLPDEVAVPEPDVEVACARAADHVNDDHSRHQLHPGSSGSGAKPKKPHVTFRDEVEEFSAPRTVSSTTEGSESSAIVDVDDRDRRSPGQSPVAGSGAREPPPALTLTPNELQERRLRSFKDAARTQDESGPRGDRSGGSTSHVTGDGDGSGGEEGVSTLDFLKEASQVILPDFMNTMFASTSSFFERSKEKVADALPDSVKRAADKTQQGMSMVLDFTSDVIGSAPAYFARVIPKAVMSDETKHLVFVDFASVMRCCVNVNVLVVPFVFRAAGLVGAIVVLAVVAVIGCYCTEAFFAAKNQLRDAAYVVTYGDVPRLTWGRWFNGLSMAYSTLFLIAFTAYAASNALVLLNTMGMYGSGATALSVIIPPLCSFPFVMCKRARSASAMGSLTTLLILAAVILLFVALPYHTIGKQAIPLGPGSVTEFFVGLNTAIYVFTPLSLAVPVERAMSPRRFTKLLRVCTATQYLLAVAFGLCVFLSLTDGTCAVLPVSIHRAMATSISMHNVDAGLSAVLFFAFLWFIPRLFFSIGELCDQRVLGLRTIPSYWQFKPNVVRLLYLALVSLAAYVIPYFGIWMALAGALSCTVAGILIPAALDYVRRERLGLLHGRLPRWWELFIVFSLVLFGLAVVLVGGVLSIYAMWAVVQAGALTTC